MKRYNTKYFSLILYIIESKCQILISLSHEERKVCQLRYDVSQRYSPLLLMLKMWEIFKFRIKLYEYLVLCDVKKIFRAVMQNFCFYCWLYDRCSHSPHVPLTSSPNLPPLPSDYHHKVVCLHGLCIYVL